MYMVQNIAMGLLFTSLVGLNVESAQAQGGSDAVSNADVEVVGKPPYFEPERGTALRKDILNSVREVANRIYGSPVEFIVAEMRVSKDLAFVDLMAQRPGGGEIDITATPGFAEGFLTLDPGDPRNLSAILKREASGWKVSRHVAGATEAWWLNDCSAWIKILPESCATVTQQSTSTSSEVNSLNAPGCASVSPPLDTEAILAALNGKTVYGRSPVSEIPWRWRFEALETAGEGSSVFSTQGKTEITPTSLENGRVCEKDGAETVSCETVHLCSSREMPLLFQSEFGDWTYVDAIYENSEKRLEWQHAVKKKEQPKPPTNMRMSSPLLESDLECQLWSSLTCMGLGLGTAFSNVTLQELLEKQVLPGTSRSLDDTLYLNGWTSDDLSRLVGVIDKEFAWIAYDGFRPEDLDKQAVDYSFANLECRSQLVELEENKVRCEVSRYRRLGSFLHDVNRSHKLEEFLKLNGLPSDAGADFSLQPNTFYRIPAYK